MPNISGGCRAPCATLVPVAPPWLPPPPRPPPPSSPVALFICGPLQVNPPAKAKNADQTRGFLGSRSSGHDSHATLTHSLSLSCTPRLPSAQSVRALNSESTCTHTSQTKRCTSCCVTARTGHNFCSQLTSRECA